MVSAKLVHLAVWRYIDWFIPLTKPLILVPPEGILTFTCFSLAGQKSHRAADRIFKSSIGSICLDIIYSRCLAFNYDYYFHENIHALFLTFLAIKGQVSLKVVGLTTRQLCGYHAPRPLASSLFYSTNRLHQ